MTYLVIDAEFEVLLLEVELGTHREVVVGHRALQHTHATHRKRVH